MRESSSEAPNFYSARDFNNFQKLTDLQPQASFNWLQTELLNWHQADRRNNQGVLYKPEDFDITKKYPVIFGFMRSDLTRFFRFPKLELADESINIPFMVSRGYLVFSPDIHYKIGQPGQSAYNAVSDAAKYLSRMPWIDSSRMGITGQSFGGL